MIAPGIATSGGAFDVTVIAQDPYGNTDTSYAGTVAITSSDGQAVLPDDSALTDGVGTFHVTLKTAGDQSITATDTVSSGITGSESGLAIAPAAASTYTIAPGASDGGAVTVVVTAFDAFGNVATGYTGTVHFTSSDPLASLPGNYTFTAADAGVHTFSVIFNTAGTESLTVTDILEAAINGTETGITVTRRKH